MAKQKKGEFLCCIKHGLHTWCVVSWHCSPHLETVKKGKKKPWGGTKGLNSLLAAWRAWEEPSAYKAPQPAPLNHVRGGRECTFKDNVKEKCACTAWRARGESNTSECLEGIPLISTLLGCLVRLFHLGLNQWVSKVGKRTCCHYAPVMYDRIHLLKNRAKSNRTIQPVQAKWIHNAFLQQVDVAKHQKLRGWMSWQKI